MGKLTTPKQVGRVKKEDDGQEASLVSRGDSSDLGGPAERFLGSYGLLNGSGHEA